jgi:hypothetical protein
MVRRRRIGDIERMSQPSTDGNRVTHAHPPSTATDEPRTSGNRLFP